MSKSQRRGREKEKKKERRGRVCKVCDTSAHSGGGYCLNHLPDKLRCTHDTRKGRRCRLPAVNGADVCRVHLNTMERGYGKGKYGWVYVYDTMSKKDGKGIYKIGRSVNPKCRLQEFRSCNPFGEIVFAGFVGSQAKMIEAKLHRRYRLAWMGRELFVLAEADLDEIYWTLQTVSEKWMGTHRALKKRSGVVYGF